MQLLHAHSTTVLAQARPTMFCIRLVGASVSEPHIDEFAANFPYISICYSYITPRRDVSGLQSRARGREAPECE